MGHILNHSWIDFMARFRRSQGDAVYFPQGFDCHGLPTELKVQAMTGLNPKQDREAFLAACRRITEEFIANMTAQFDSIGYSTDWNFSYKTMDSNYTKLVQESLLQFYRKGLLYRANYPIHWCPQCETSLAKQEVGYLEQSGTLWEIALPLEHQPDQKITISTTRPEMIEACIAVFIHPEDQRYFHLQNKSISVPLTDRVVPIISDPMVDINFGTGAVYCCTFGDETDILWQQKYHLPIIQIFTESGKMTSISKFAGLSSIEARYQILKELEIQGLFEGKQTINHRVMIHSERSSCQSPIEFLPIPQWFIKIKEFTKEIADDGQKLQWHPDLSSRLTDWCNSLTWDWVISRQRVFGTPIPFWHCSNPACDHIEMPSEDDLPLDPTQVLPHATSCPKCGSPVIGEKDVCDCWVDSSITPLVIARWRSDQQFFARIYPITNRSQGYEIIRTWLFYTLHRCKQLTGISPFKETMINGMVAGPDGRKMSKSFGNVVTPNEVIPEYGADAIRLWAAMGPAGQDYPFKFDWVDAKNPKLKIGKRRITQDFTRLQKGQITAEKFQSQYGKQFPGIQANGKFITKIWNAYRLLWIQLQETPPIHLRFTLDQATPIDWYILDSLATIQGSLKDEWQNYRWKEGMEKLRHFFKNLLCDQYLEAIKYRWHDPDPKIRQIALQIALSVFFETLKMLGIILPFITEEIFEKVYRPFSEEPSIHQCQWHKISLEPTNSTKIAQGHLILNLISTIRAAKAHWKIPLNREISSLELYLNPNQYKLLSKDVIPIKATLNIHKLSLFAIDHNYSQIMDSNLHWYSDESIPCTIQIQF